MVVNSIFEISKLVAGEAEEVVEFGVSNRVYEISSLMNAEK